MAAGRNTLLKLALPLVQSHGFTRQALSLSVLSLPSGSHQAPLNDTAVSDLFGDGDDARRTLITAWLDEARTTMATATTAKTIGGILDARLKANEPVLQYLPEVWPSSRWLRGLYSSAIEGFCGAFYPIIICKVLTAAASRSKTRYFPCNVNRRRSVSSHR